jgi:hypothetical protein
MTSHAIPPGDDDLRASDHDRDNTVEQLTEAATDGRLTLDEYNERVASALTARRRGELASLTRDLGHAGTPASPAVPVAATQLTAILGNESRKGRWVVPGHLSLKSVLGDCHIEMQEATLQSRVTTIDVVAIFGSVTIFVPEGLDVRMTGTAVAGAKSVKLREEPRPGAPVLNVNCRILCGSVTVRPPRWWEALRGTVALAAQMPCAGGTPMTRAGLRSRRGHGYVAATAPAGWRRRCRWILPVAARGRSSTT